MKRLLAIVTVAACLILPGALPAHSQEATEKETVDKEAVESDDKAIDKETETEEEWEDEFLDDILDKKDEEEGKLTWKKDDVKFTLKGLVKDLYFFKRTKSYFDENFFTRPKNLSSNLTRVRLTPEFSYDDILFITADYDNELIATSYNQSIDFNNYWRRSNYNELIQMSWEPYYDSHIYYRTKFNRAYLKISKGPFTGTIGRQQIRFGSGRLWNPLDILNPISPTYVEGPEDQPGTDAIRLDFYPGETTELSIVFNPKRSHNKIEYFNFQDCNYIARLKTSIDDFDFAILGGYIARRGVAGLDISAVVLDGIFRAGAIASKPEDSDLFIQASSGYEYTFKKGVYFLLEYFYNMNGINYNDDLKTAYTLTALGGMNQQAYYIMANQFLTLNQHYISLALGYDFHALVRGEFFTIWDIQGNGIFLVPALKINAYDNLDFNVGVMMGHVFKSTPSDFTEFKMDYLYYGSVSFYF